MDKVAFVFGILAILGALVAFLLVWRVDQKIMRSFNITAHRIDRIESDAIAMRSRLGSVEQTTTDQGKQIYKLNAAVFDKAKPKKQ